MEIAAIGLIGVVMGSIIALFATVWQARVTAREVRMSSRRDYLMNLMQQLIVARLEFALVIQTGGHSYDDYVKPVATATAIAQALGDEAISTEVKRLGSNALDSHGLTLIDYVIQQVSHRIKQLGGI